MVENDLFGKLRQPRLDITRGSGIVSRQDVAEVTLRIHKQVFLSKLHQSITDGSITMRMVFHRVAHDVGHLVEATIVEFVHRVQDAALHGLQTVLNGGHGSFKDDIRSIVEKPVLEHALQGDDMMFILLSLSVLHTFKSLVRQLLVLGFVLQIVFDFHYAFSNGAKIKIFLQFTQQK